MEDGAMTDVTSFEPMMKELFPGTLGMRLVEASPERVRASLAVERRLCTVPGILHGGAIMVDTTARRGTTFVVTLPAVQPA